MNTHNNEMPKTNCLALTVRKEHRLMVIENTFKKTTVVSFKVVLAVMSLTLLNMFV